MRRRIKIILVCLAVAVVVTIAAVAGVKTWLAHGHVDVVTKPRTGTSIAADQKVADFEYLRTILKENFPYFAVKKRNLGIDWLSRSSEFEADLRATPDDASYFLELTRIVSLIQNAHTQVCTPDEMAYYASYYSGVTPWGQVLWNTNVLDWYDYWQRVLPKNSRTNLPVLFQYVDGAYVAESSYGGAPLPSEVSLGSVLTAVDGVPVNDYVRSLGDTMPLAHDYDRNLSILPQLYLYGDPGKQHTVGLLTPTGVSISVVLKAVDPTMAQGKYQPNVTTAVLDGGDIAYLGIRSLTHQAVESDQDTILSFLKENRTAKALIVDIRGNGGGDDTYWVQNLVAPLLCTPMTAVMTVGLPSGAYSAPFMRNKLGMLWFRRRTPSQLADQKGFKPELYAGATSFFRWPLTVSPKEPVGFSERVFLLVDDCMYSSAESFAVWAKATGWATLVGTRTRGDGIGFDPGVVALPNSGIVVRFTEDMGINPDGSVNEESQTVPDVVVQQTVADERMRLKLMASDPTGVDVAHWLPGDAVLKKAIELAKN